MARDEMVTLSKGGTKERSLKVSEIDIPDLWHLAMNVKKKLEEHELSRIDRDDHELLAEFKQRQEAGETGGAQAFEAITSIWHLASDLRNHIVERPTPEKAKARR